MKISAILIVCLAMSTAFARQYIVPGTGKIVNQDTFEQEGWSFKYRGQSQWGKPVYSSSNRRWSGNNKRVVPDSVQAVQAPAGALENSKKAMVFQTKNMTKPEKRPNSTIGQADLLMIENGRSIPLERMPNFTVRVYMPEWSKWEQRYGPTLGIRMYMRCTMTSYEETSSGFFGRRSKRPVTKVDDYYPGFWIHFVPNQGRPFARFTLRANNQGYDFPQFRGNSVGSTPEKHRITTTGWWTFGASMLPGGTVQYYASPGVDPLTKADFVAESKPYECMEFNKIFFDVVSDGQNWSTAWMIDDPTIYVAK